MHYNSDVFRSQFPIAKRFIYHVTYYRTIHKMYQKHDIKSEFWTHTSDAHLLQASILWCMIFGTNDNPIHWKKLSLNYSKEFEVNFQKGLLQSTQMSLEEWKSYHQEMITFRNEFVAHRELDYNGKIPNFDYAIAIIYYYDQWIREIISPDIFEEPMLKNTVKELYAIESLMESLILNTKDYNGLSLNSFI